MRTVAGNLLGMAINGWDMPPLRWALRACLAVCLVWVGANPRLSAAPADATKEGSAAAQGPAQPGKGPILQGHVRDEQGHPLPGARIVLYGGIATRWKIGEATSDSAGCYRFDSLPQAAMLFDEAHDRWRSYIGIEIYHPTHASADGISWRDIRVPIVDRHLETLDFPMVPGGSVTGQIVDAASGKPVANLCLRINSPTPRNPKFSRYACSDAHGRFKVEALFPGTYTIDVNSSRLRYPFLGAVSIAARENSEVSFRTTAEPDRKPQEVINELKAHGLEIRQKKGGNRLSVTLPHDFQPTPTPLPLDHLAGLPRVTVGHEGISAEQLRAHLLAVRKAPRHTTLDIRFSAQSAPALDALSEMPQLESLELYTWPQAEDAGAGELALGDHFDRLTSLQSLSWRGLSDANLAEVARLKSLKRLALYGDLTESGLGTLAALSNVEDLQLGRNVVRNAQVATPVDLACLAGMPRLNSLQVGTHLTLTDAAAVRVARLKSLHTLQVDVGGMSNEGMRQLVRAEALEILRIRAQTGAGNLTPEGLAALGGLKRLKRLEFEPGAPEILPLRITDESIAGWQDLTGLTVLRLTSCQITDKGAAAIGRLADLKTLALVGDVDLSEQGLTALAQLSDLGSLVLTAKLLKDADLPRLASLERLTQLTLSDARQLTDDCLPAIAQFKQLRSLKILNARVSGSGATVLAGLNQLQILDLSRCRVDDTGLAQLAAIDGLRELDLSATAVTDDGLAALANHMPQLARLDLSFTGVTGTGCRYLSEHKNLRELHLDTISETNRQQLEAAVPGLRVFYMTGRLQLISDRDE